MYSVFVAWSTLNSRRVASPLVRWVEEEERWETPDDPQGILPQNWSETEQNRSIACIMLKATANDRRYLALYHDEFPINADQIISDLTPSAEIARKPNYEQTLFLTARPFLHLFLNLMHHHRAFFTVLKLQTRSRLLSELRDQYTNALNP
ncbi:uncharacterized protein TNCV_2339191 [Trichonephila clavipes]|nr:uncharacterized protein TNCV_2339191 [Trichonephila clavipes]